MVIRVGNTRVALDTVIGEYNAGSTPEEIVYCFDSLNLADVRATIDFYLRNRVQVDAYLAERVRIGEEMRRLYGSPLPPQVRERILALKASRKYEE